MDLRFICVVQKQNKARGGVNWWYRGRDKEGRQPDPLTQNKKKQTVWCLSWVNPLSSHTFTSLSNLVSSDWMCTGCPVLCSTLTVPWCVMDCEVPPPPSLSTVCLLEREWETGRESVKENTSGYVLSHNACAWAKRAGFIVTPWGC